MLFAWPISNWGYGLAPFRLGMWMGRFLVGDMDRPPLLLSLEERMEL